ncbi:MAG: hypothetical protein HC892_22155, partial [Saprospiraceae bacterium]|nr:hypothetical protein [Saprospiraceae bacterium]
VWLPKGYDGFSNYYVDIDPGFSDGVLDILVYRYPKSGGKGDGYQHFRIGGSLKSTGLYPIEKGSRQSFVFYDEDTNCEYLDKDSTCQYSGYLNITTYDYDLGKVQGKFELTITKPGCKTITITDGRFAWQYQ